MQLLEFLKHNKVSNLRCLFVITLDFSFSFNVQEPKTITFVYLSLDSENDWTSINFTAYAHCYNSRNVTEPLSQSFTLQWSYHDMFF